MNWVAPIKDIKTIKKFESALRDIDDKYYIMFEIGIGTGMQVNDILQLKVGDVRDKDSITVHIGKQETEQNFDIPEELQKTIHDYTEGKDPDSFLLTARKTSNNPMSREQAYKALNKAGKSIGLTSIGAQTMRKTWAWQYYNRTGDIYYIQHILNHSSPSITYRFIGEKPSMETNLKKQTTEENELSREQLCLNHAGEKRFMAIINRLNEISRSLEDPRKNDAYYGKCDEFLSSLEEMLQTFDNT